MKTKHIVLAVVLALQCAWVLGTSIMQERVLSHGQVVLLETRPVDPRDLLRGDYVILNYEISTIPAQLFLNETIEDQRAGTPVYVALKKQGEFHRATRASFAPLVADGNEVIVTGHLQSDIAAGAGEPRLLYNLERYYVPEGTGNPRGKLTVEAAVSANGEARIKRVFIDGKPYADVMREQGQGPVR